MNGDVKKADCEGNDGKHGCSIQGLVHVARVKDTVANGEPLALMCVHVGARCMCISCEINYFHDNIMMGQLLMS